MNKSAILNIKMIRSELLLPVLPAEIHCHRRTWPCRHRHRRRRQGHVISPTAECLPKQQPMKTTLLERRRSQGHMISPVAECLPKQQQMKTTL